MKKEIFRYFQSKEYNYALEKLYFNYLVRGECDYLRNPYDHESSINYTTDRVYAFSNEKLDVLFQNLDVEGKSVLTVGSSGEQVLESIYHGAKNVTLADFNVNARMYTELKMAAIKNLGYEDFLNYFTCDNLLNSKYYAKVSHDLSPVARLFWDNLMMDLTPTLEADMLSAFAQRDKRGGTVPNDQFTYNRSNCEFYADEDKYNLLKSRLNNCTVDFLCADFKDFPKVLEHKYDSILLSNIWDYTLPNNYYDTLQGLKEFLNDDGQIQLTYSFGAQSRKLFTEWLRKKFSAKIEPIMVSNESKRAYFVAKKDELDFIGQGK